MSSSTLNRPQRAYTVDNLTGSITTVGSSLIYSEQVSYQDTVRRLKPKDLWATQTSRHHQTWSVEYDSSVYRYQNGRYTRYDTTAGSHGVLGLDPFVADRSAIVGDLGQRIRSTVKDQKVNLMLSISEGKEAVSMVNKLCRDALKEYRDLRKRGLLRLRDLGKLKTREGLTKAQKSAANRWLELQYGWLPTVSDIYGLAWEASEKARTGVTLFAEVKSARTAVKDTATSGSNGLKTHTELHQYGNAICKYVVTSGQLNKTSKLGFTNAAEFLWEKIPYSFVFDALYDVGSTLHGLDAFTGIDSYAWIYAVKTEATLIRTPVAPANIKPGSSRGTYKSYTRISPSAYVPIGYPRWNSKAPTIKRLANYISLLRQLR